MLIKFNIKILLSKIHILASFFINNLDINDKKVKKYLFENNTTVKQYKKATKKSITCKRV